MNHKASTGVINANESYASAEFCRRTGMARHTFSTVRRRGLKVVKIGAKVFVLGRHWLEFLEQQAEATTPAETVSAG